MTPPDAANARPQDAMVLRELDGLRCDLRDLRTDVGERLDDIIVEARRTNGRLRRMELWLFAARVIVGAMLAGVPFVLFVLNRNL